MFRFQGAVFRRGDLFIHEIRQRVGQTSNDLRNEVLGIVFSPDVISGHSSDQRRSTIVVETVFDENGFTLGCFLFVDDG